MKQEVCVIAVAALLILAAGLIETRPAISLLLIAAMSIPVTVGRLGKRRVSVRDIERRLKSAKN